MQQKITSILLTLLYLISNSGFAMNLGTHEMMDANSCDMECCAIDSSSEMNSLEVMSCNMDMTELNTKVIPSITNFITSNHNPSHKCEIKILILITSTDVVISSNSSSTYSFEPGIVNDYSYLLKRLQLLNLDSRLSFYDNQDVIYQHKEPSYIEYGRLILYS